MAHGKQRFFDLKINEFFQIFSIIFKKVLELNLMAAPQVAEAILQMETWNQFNRNKIAVLCEQKGLFQRALELYSDLKDVKRVILNTQFISPEWLTAFLGKMQQQEWLLACLQDLMKHNRYLIAIGIVRN